MINAVIILITTKEIVKEAEIVKKVLLFDIDGTLLSYDGVLPESAIKGIRLARDKGYYVFIVTGRSKGHIDERVEAIGFDGLIGGNGAYIEIGNRVLRSKTILPEDLKRIVDYLDEKKMEYYIETNEGVYGSKNFAEESQKALAKYGNRKNGVDLWPNIEYPDCMYVKNATKVNFLLKSEKDYEEFKNYFSEFEVMTWGGKGEDKLFGDCALGGINKADAIKELLRYLEVDSKDVISFGDAEVDIPMFEISDISICLGEGRQAAKNAATYVTASVEDDGIWKALVRFGIINQED